ncbi:MAG: hypothetical protein WAU21_04160 [Chitinophagales bacterium]|nr:hypothetical protein [Bacteroidota bacterium]MBP8754349.1 hypothetical protein [Chitinophagales bacterium]MBK8680369.1 hypothetical protein [Bacteroidota bacterium]MBP9188243.1 hypothetical protein [Chitinophagales bacterium]MBP9548632.1 hypothetical protein [Chitinophagales bacterium]
MKSNIQIIIIVTVLITSCFLFSACQINGTSQGLIGYYNKTKDLSPDLLVEDYPEENLCNVKNDSVPQIYIVNGIALKKCISQSSEALLYIWSPHCKGKYCYSFDLLQEYCTNKKLELFIVAEYYDYDLMNKNYIIDKPIFGIDTKHYHTQFTSQYRSKFIFDLTQQNQYFQGNFFYFQEGIFIKSVENLDSL